MAVNRAFSSETKARIKNTSDNASVFAFLAPVGDAHVNGNGREIKAGKSRNFTMADLGDINDTFLLVHNLSNVNDAGYVIEILFVSFCIIRPGLLPGFFLIVIIFCWLVCQLQ